MVLRAPARVAAHREGDHDVGDEEDAVDRAEDLDPDLAAAGPFDHGGDQQGDEAGRLGEGDVAHGLDGRDPIGTAWAGVLAPNRARSRVMQKPLPGSGLRPGIVTELQALGPGLAAGRVLAQNRGLWLVAVADGEGWAPQLLTARAGCGDDAGHRRLGRGRLRRRDRGRARAPLPARAPRRRRRGRGAGAGRQRRPGPDRRGAAGAERAPGRALRLAGRGERDPGRARPHQGGPRPRRRRDRRPAAPPPRPRRSAGVSVRSGDGLPGLRSLLAPEATTALLGTSGAGKSTLVNTLLGEERQATAPVREKDGLGRHTTVTRELIELPDGALLLDTPGLREVGLWVDAGSGFEDVERLAASCRFNDCAHRTSPAARCARPSSPDRLAAWHRLADEQASLSARRRG